MTVSLPFFFLIRAAISKQTICRAVQRDTGLTGSERRRWEIRRGWRHSRVSWRGTKYRGTERYRLAYKGKFVARPQEFLRGSLLYTTSYNALIARERKRKHVEKRILRDRSEFRTGLARPSSRRASTTCCFRGTSTRSGLCTRRPFDTLGDVPAFEEVGAIYSGRTRGTFSRSLTQTFGNLLIFVDRCLYYNCSPSIRLILTAMDSQTFLFICIDFRNGTCLVSFWHCSFLFIQRRNTSINE